jgi:hypothetical protein
MKQLNRKWVLGVASILVLLSLTINSCTKEKLEIKHIVLISDTLLAKQISSSDEFKSILLNIGEIKTAIKTNTLLRHESGINNNLFNEATSITNEPALNLFLLKLGYKNAEVIVRYTLINTDLFLKLINTFPELNKRDKESVLMIFKLAFLLDKSNTVQLVKPYMLADECSSNYAFGIQDCSEGLGWDLIAAQIGLALPTPVNLGATLILSGIAYLKEYSCKINVVERWQACRATHPI